MKDFRGTDLFVGSTVVYPVRHGANVQMKTGVIQRFVCSCGMTQVRPLRTLSACSSGRISIKVEKAQGSIVKLTNLTNVVVV